KDSSICKKECISELGYAKHYNALLSTICPVCKKKTYSNTGICSNYNKIYDYAWYGSKKTKTESNMVKT
ncbi:6659_t:CDS:1, partial [Cetraspora pellucida]